VAALDPTGFTAWDDAVTPIWARPAIYIISLFLLK